MKTTILLLTTLCLVNCGEDVEFRNYDATLVRNTNSPSKCSPEALTYNATFTVFLFQGIVKEVHHEDYPVLIPLTDNQRESILAFSSDEIQIRDKLLFVYMGTINAEKMEGLFTVGRDNKVGNCYDDFFTTGVRK